MSFSRTGPLTFLTIERVESSMNSTRTWVTPPREPVRPRTLTTLASLTGTLFEVVSYSKHRGSERRRGRESANPELMERRAQAVSRFDLAVSILVLASFPLCDSLDNAAWTAATASIETARESREVAR